MTTDTHLPNPLPHRRAGSASPHQPGERHASDAETPPEPWPLVLRARALISRHLAAAPAAIDTLIFWCMHTHAHSNFEVSPRLILHGRDARADHARALRVLSWLTPNPRLIARATSYGVLDLLAHERATLLFDDAANAILARRDLRALIAAGARRDGMFLGSRAAGKQSRFRACAAPLALATCRTPPDDILGHAIVVPLTPALLRDDAERAAIADPPHEALILRMEFQALTNRLANKQLALTAPLPTFLSAAARETWTPLFAFAQAMGSEAEAAVRAAASQFASPEHLEPPTSPRALLRDIRRLVGVDEQPVSSTALVEDLTRDPDSPWVACDWGNRLTPRGVAQRLAHFDIKPQVIYPANAPAFRGYKAEALLTAFARYLDDPVALAVLRRGQGEA